MTPAREVHMDRVQGSDHKLVANGKEELKLKIPP